MTNRTRTLASFALVAIAAVAFTTPPGRTLAHRALTRAGIVGAPAPVRPGDRMRPIAAEAIDGTRVTLGTETHGVTVYNVFTSWCPSCKLEAPEFAAAASTLRPKGVRFVGIDQQESPQVVARLQQSEGLPFPVVIDTDASTKSILGARMIPTTVIVRDGIVTDVSYGPLTREQLVAMVERAR